MYLYANINRNRNVFHKDADVECEQCQYNVKIMSTNNHVWEKLLKHLRNKIKLASILVF